MTTRVGFPAALIVSLALNCGACTGAPGPVDVTAGRYDDARTGANLRESVLTPEAIRRKGLGRLFTYNVEGFIYAQPLVATGVTTASGPRNMLIVATTTNKLYALDADTNMPGGGVIWQADLTVPGGTLTEDQRKFRESWLNSQQK